MKKSKINPLEAHFEKLILVVVSGVLLAVVAMQFLTQPNAVQVGSNPIPLAPDRVFDPIETEAEALLARMRDVNPPLPEVPEQDVAGQFAAVSNLSIADSIRVTMLGEGVDIEEHDIGSVGSDAATTYAMPALPVPAALAVATHRATIDPYEAITNEELRAYLPQEQPFDTVAVSVEGTISGASLLASLEEDPDGEDGPMRPLPLQWWRGNLELLGVEVEREELGADGSWGGMTVLSGVPGRDTLLSEARQDGITPAELVQVARSAEELMREIAQPAFPQTIAGSDWTRPSEMSSEIGMSEEDREIATLERRYESLEKRRDGLLLQLESVGSGGGGNEDRGGERGGRGGEGGRPSTTRTPVDRDQQKRDILQTQIDAAERQMERLADQLADLGAPVDQDQAQDSQGNQPEPPLPALLEAEELPVWVHDFGAEPGKMYRYRMRVVVNNPLFAKEQYLSDAQQASAGSPTVEGAWSGWSSPITVERDRHFFVVSGSESDVLGNGPRAAVEVYQFYYGYWRKGSTTLEPGDSIHARAKLPENLLLWDLAKLEEMGPQSGVRRLAGERQDFGRDPEGGESRRRFFEGGNPDRPTQTARQPRGSGNVDAADLPDGAEKAPETLDLVLSAILLDVMPTPGDKDSTRVVLRDPEGRLVMRLTAADRASQLYKRLVSNAREGETQGQPKIDPDENRPNVPIPDERRREFEDEGGGGPGGG